MKKVTFFAFLIILSFSSNAQFYATVQMDEPIEGMCGETLYSLFSGLEEQEQPKCDISEADLIAKMDTELRSYLEEHPKLKAKGVVMSIDLNCEGEIIGTSSGITDKHAELGALIEKFLVENGHWTPGVFYGNNVDCHELIGYRIKKGMIYLD
ncbi:MAG: hypothetical protein QNK23_04105 [Crocinitomicaceae bacterium]|nr:hypothetical protein [Crocinitomicaceae bacterium]